MSEKTLQTNKRVLQVIRLLRENGKMTCTELSVKLGLKNNRSIYNYKKYIELMGIPIKTVGGNRGGLKIEMPPLLTNDELLIIMSSEIPENIKLKIEQNNMVL